MHGEGKVVLPMWESYKKYRGTELLDVRAAALARVTFDPIALILSAESLPKLTRDIA